MRVEIITIGDELLIGQVVDTNSAWIGQRLNGIGASVQRITSISDDMQAIKAAIADAAARADVVLVTGGLGPTNDDITKVALCEYFNCGTVFHGEVLEHIEQLFRRFDRTVSEVNRQQAALPENCEALHNALGTAPGMWFDTGATVIVSMPGVPYEMKSIMADEVLPRLVKRFNAPTILHRTVLTMGLGESWLAERIADWENALPKQIKLAYLPAPGRVRLRLSAIGADEQRLRSELGHQVKQLWELIPELVYGFDEDTIESVVAHLLRKRNMTVCTAESCTGGTISQMLTSVPGASNYFPGGVVTYSYGSKMRELGVLPQTLETLGAVSEQTVVEMADGARRKFGTDFAVSVSGIAGPDGGTPDKPVGTVWMAVAGPDRTVAKKFLFGDNRERNIERSALSALNLLRKEILKS
ncbi:MAG: competence/damage-inducible protein A [Flavobacteriales bacterium]|nr:competence/damage-inducible protein A [Flavobacteriales bacterium]